MQARSQRATWPVRLALVLVVGVAAAAAALLALMWAKAPAASAQEGGPANEPAFVVRCDYSHRNKDDPIVYPGQPGAAHSHDFFGNRSTNFASTSESLQAATTTCVNTADKSAYWIPTVSWTDSRGTRTLTASRGVFYYRAGGKAPEEVQPHPAGLKVVPNTHVTWRCAQGPLSTSPPTRCSNGTLVVLIRFPDCSDGTIDSADHRSHMAYSVRNPDGTKGCPSTHPTPVPALTMDVRFSIPTTSGTVRLSSDHAGAPPGSTMHADFFNGWNQEKLAALVSSCINAYPFSAANPKPAECKATG